MNRTERLFQIVEIIRSRNTTTAQYLADRLELSVRTIYRHINDLSVSGIPIVSETGVGYWLDKSFDMPPLMLNEDEILALSLGAKLVEQCADEMLAQAAKSLLKKVLHGLPQYKAELLLQSTIHAPYSIISEQDKLHMASCRKAIEKQVMIDLNYLDAQKKISQRTVRPLALAFWGNVWTLATFCEKRQSFRSFRLDRINSLLLLEKPFMPTDKICLQAFIDHQTSSV